jgi:hypothetical protein
MSGNDWQTPETILDRVRAVDEIKLDPCTVASNPARAKRIVTPEHDPDGLLAEWSVIADGGLVFANIPFGRGVVAEWAAKIVSEAAHGAEIIALTRGDMSTKWARQMATAARLVCFPPRIRFRGATGSPNFTNTIFYYGPRPQTFRRAFADLGPIVVPITKPTTKKDKRS